MRHLDVCDNPHGVSGDSDIEGASREDRRQSKVAPSEGNDEKHTQESLGVIVTAP